MSDARKLLDRQISEKQFQQQIIELAQRCGFLVYHTFDSRRSEPGFPDLTLCHPTEPRPIFFLEVKAEKGRVRPEQRKWIEALDPGPVMQDYVIARIVRPSDWWWVEQSLTGGNPRTNAESGV